MRRYLLNSPVLAEFGEYRYRKATPSDVARFADAESAIGHPGTAEVMTSVLGYPVETRRQFVSLELGDQALVFQLRTRLTEGQVLTAEELRNLEYRLGVLERQ